MDHGFHSSVPLTWGCSRGYMWLQTMEFNSQHKLGFLITMARFHPRNGEMAVPLCFDVILVPVVPVPVAEVLISWHSSGSPRCKLDICWPLLWRLGLVVGGGVD